MSGLAPASFLSHLKSLYPLGRTSGALPNPWYIVAAVAYSASNKAEAVPEVFQYALQEAKVNKAADAEQFLLAQKIREALFKSGLISGYPRAINSLKTLHEVMPDELREKKIQRNIHASLAEHERVGMNLWRSVYGDTSDGVQKLLDDIYPDMGKPHAMLVVELIADDCHAGYFSRTIGYGFTYGHTEVLSALETSYTLVAALIAGDTPQQIFWHLNGARRGGATLEEVQAVRQISIEVAGRCGISWSDGVPEVPEKLAEEQQ
ncbi:hypothetical protein P691DRAFT_795272 [Macrolepiota fuliginosa MF-IS2]|uniref:Carboxymuconolactone decarboxylase-like domain-containing protein n=1 Tax=Macrolepiota fuliginosa MF-IS2 TaxID=1400762 RepID=A0A9P5XIY2_9AGAR|nr:hypothetical protein P691DRAFT_795272 [Macrolepiota fuliginosa MF-IS2]